MKSTSKKLMLASGVAVVAASTIAVPQVVVQAAEAEVNLNAIEMLDTEGESKYVHIDLVLEYLNDKGYTLTAEGYETLIEAEFEDLDELTENQIPELDNDSDDEDTSDKDDEDTSDNDKEDESDGDDDKEVDEDTDKDKDKDGDKDDDGDKEPAEDIEFESHLNKEITVDLNDYFDNLDRFDYDIKEVGKTGSSQGIEVTRDKDNLTFKALSRGEFEVVMKTFSDTGKVIQEQTVSLKVVNQEIEILNNIQDMTFTMGDKIGEIDVKAYFEDPDGDEINFTFTTSSKEENFLFHEKDGKIQVLDKTPGTSTVTVIASDGHGSKVSTSFTVTIEKSGDAKDDEKEDKSSKTIVGEETSKLPQTGMESGFLTSALGMLLVGLGSVVGFRRKK